jgi:hypothetical protein
MLTFFSLLATTLEDPLSFLDEEINSGNPCWTVFYELEHFCI